MSIAARRILTRPRSPWRWRLL